MTFYLKYVMQLEYIDYKFFRYILVTYYMLKNNKIGHFYKIYFLKMYLCKGF